MDTFSNVFVFCSQHSAFEHTTVMYILWARSRNNNCPQYVIVALSVFKMVSEWTCLFYDCDELYNIISECDIIFESTNERRRHIKL